MVRERVELDIDTRELVRRLQRLAASRLGRELGLGLLIFVDPGLAQDIVDIDGAVQEYGDDELKKQWERFKKRVVRKNALPVLHELSETTRLFIAVSGRRRGDEGYGYEEEEENLLGI